MVEKTSWDEAMRHVEKNRKWDAVILGAGIAGLGVARALTLQKKKVLVLEKSMEGEASPHASGILDPFVDLDFRPEILALTIPALRKYPACIRQIENETHMKTGYQKLDLLYAAFSEKEEKKLRYFKSLPELQKKIHVHWLNREEIQKKEPEISSRVSGGLYLPGIARVFPTKLIQSLRVWLKQRGVAFQTIKEMPQLLIQNKEIVGIRLGSRTIETAKIVSCLGAWAGAQGKGSILWEPVEPLRGQILIYPRKKPLQLLLHTVDGGYLIPWEKKSVLAGSTVEKAGFAPRVTSEGRKKIHSYAERLLPELKGKKPERVWAGLRPHSLTQQPRIGKTRISGYYVANGYYRCGILIALYAGELLAQLMRTGKTPKVLRPFSPVLNQSSGRSQ